jgi:hypothetical protein
MGIRSSTHYKEIRNRRKKIGIFKGEVEKAKGVRTTIKKSEKKFVK